MNDKSKAFFFFLIVVIYFYINPIQIIPFQTSIVLTILTFIFWNTQSTQFPRLSGLIPNKFEIKNVFISLAGVIAFFLPYFLIILSDGHSISITDSYWDDFIFLVNQSVLEELLFRGVIFFVAVRYFGIWKVSITLALIFMALHLSNPNPTVIGAINTFLASILFSAMAYTTKSLYMPIAFHVGWNVTQGMILDLPVSGFDYPGLFYHTTTFDNVVLGNAYGPESGLWCTLFIISFIFIAIKYSSPYPINSAQWFEYTFGKKKSD